MQTIKSNIYIHKKDILKILETMEKFPSESNYQLVYDNTPGLGYCIDMIIPLTLDNQKGEFKVPIVGVENW